MTALQQHPPKRIPVRTCVVCREKAGKRTLVRIVRTEDGIQVDETGKMNGRGAYVCDRTSCWERVVQTDVLAQALRTQITHEDRERLQQAKPRA
ncbi:MAG: YlxR family protein [Chloroflexi bacterium]|nr:YlxR family protein [Chloroflexota bacterium]MCC6896475.1 YlxR family protein [Anaerolineae bacterium]